MEKTLNDLNDADYNPRHISDKKLDSLKNALHELGDLGGIVFNRRTTHLVGGHQRKKALPPDARIEIEKHYDLPTRTGTVAEGYVIVDGERYFYREVDWPEEKEKLANLAANNQGGENVDAMLSEILKELNNFNIDLSLTGLDLDDLQLNEEGVLDEVIEELKPYRMSHILISFPPDKLMAIAPHLEKIFDIEGVEHEQSSN